VATPLPIEARSSQGKKRRQGHSALRIGRSIGGEEPSKSVLSILLNTPYINSTCFLIIFMWQLLCQLRQEVPGKARKEGKATVPSG